MYHKYIVDLAGLFGIDMSDIDGYLYIGFLFCIIVVLWRVFFRQNVKVNCWFCGNDNIVPRYSKLWWICTVCDQYNGFKKNGDYLNEIPDMFNEPIPPRRFCITNKNNVKTTNLLCNLCAGNQCRIIQGFADFSPSDDRYFEEELADYKRELNSKWDLCLSCRTQVSYHLQQQNMQIQQTHNNNNNDMNQKVDKGVRRLNVKLDNPNFFIIGAYKLIHFFSFLAAIWLWQKMVLNARTDFVLINASLIFTCGTFVMYLHMKKCDVIGVLVSIIWLLVLIYGNFKTKDSRYLRKITLSILILLEGLYLCHEFLFLTMKLWKSMIYKQERKKKVDKIRDSPKWEVGKSDVTSCNDTKSKSQNNEGSRRRPSAPDILEGHLDAMFIQRKKQADYLPVKDLKDTNHVVAALKYSSASHSKLHHRVPGQLLKPATFSGQLSSGMFSGKLLRPATFSSPFKMIGSNKKKDIHTFSNMTISENLNQTSLYKQTENIIEDKCKMSKEVEGAVSGRNKMKMCTWTILIIFVFVFSIICNLILVYKVL